MKKILVVVWLTVLFGIIGAIFWYSEWIYSLPTPLPKAYNNVDIGSHINYKLDLPTNSKPIFLHFFNPDCPCSRFNMKHFKELVAQYHDEVNFAVVLMTNKDYTSLEIKKRHDLDIPVVKDSIVAKLCGVYSTPQAVIITNNNTLFYRGNYNKTRYCTDKKSNYAQIALEGLLSRRTGLKFNKFALKAYGCQLPDCDK